MILEFRDIPIYIIIISGTPPYFPQYLLFSRDRTNQKWGFVQDLFSPPVSKWTWQLNIFQWGTGYPFIARGMAPWKWKNLWKKWMMTGGSPMTLWKPHEMEVKIVGKIICRMDVPLPYVAIWFSGGVPICWRIQHPLCHRKNTHPETMMTF